MDGAKKLQPLTEADAPPDALAAIIEGGTKSLAVISDVAKAAGLSDKVTAALLKRVKAQLAPVVQEVKNVTTGHLVRELESKAAMALTYLDDLALSTASAKDLAIVIGILLEKRQLLRGEPTHIISMDERRGIDDLARMMIKETQRRGLVIDMTAEEVRVLEPSTERQTRPRTDAGGIINRKIARMHKDQDDVGEPRT